MEERPELFVARDRARRLGWRLGKVLQERRLAWRGEAIGLATLKDEADLEILAIAADARESAAQVLEGRLRDRERGWAEIPFVVAAETTALHLEAAAALESDRRAGRAAEADARRRVLAGMEAALQRLEAFQAAYDEKRVLSEARPVDLGRLLAQAAEPRGRPFDRVPPPVATDPHGLLDLLLAARTALPEAGPWRVAVERGGRLVRLRIGVEEGTREGETPPAVDRAARVLAWLHPARATARARPRPLGGDEVVGLEIEIEDPSGSDPRAAVAALVGGEGTLPPEAEPAVRALLRAPAVHEDGRLPPERAVALLGVLRALEELLGSRVLPRLGTAAVRHAARALPREATRKAPLRARLVEGLADEVPGLPFGSAGDLARDLAAGKRLPRLGPAEVAVLLALFARTWSIAGARGEAPLPRGTLEDADVEALVADLATVARLEPGLASGQAIPAAEVTRLECAAVGAIGRLARM